MKGCRRLYECVDFPSESFTVEDVRTITGDAKALVYACAIKGTPIAGFIFTVAGNVDPAAKAKTVTPAGTWRPAGTPAAAKGADAGERRWVRNTDLAAMELLPINPMRQSACDGPDVEVRT
jgi:hypothetical protein